MPDLPIACTLDPTELSARRDALLPGLAALALSSEPLPDGRRWRLAPADGLLAQLARVLDAERQCCPFLRFELTVEPGGGPVWLVVTGPPGTAEFLETITAGSASPSPQ